MKFLNLTPHPVNLLNNEGEVINTLKPEAVVPRISTNSREVDFINGVPIMETSFGGTENLPEAEHDVFLIVSRMVLAANANRRDLLVPNDLVRNDKGQIVGCKSLSRS